MDIPVAASPRSRSRRSCIPRFSYPCESFETSDGVRIESQQKEVAVQLFFLGGIIFAEPLTSTLLFPFVLFMVKDFTADPSEVGIRVGFITSSFFVCQLFTTPAWGYFADRFGRKPTLSIGLMGGAMSMICLGLSKSLAWAVMSRSMGGLLNGNMGVARTALGEVATKYGIQQAKAFSVFGLCGALGYIVGPVLGGMLAKPAESLELRGPDDVFVKFPYLLPCLASAGTNLAILLGAIFCLEETLQPKLDTDRTVEEAHERDPLIPEVMPKDTILSRSPPSSRAWHLPKGVPILMLATALVAMHSIMFEEIFPLFAAGNLQRKVGLSFNSQKIAMLLAFVGPALFAAQLVLYPFLNKRFDTIQLWRFSALIFALDYPLTSLVPLIAGNVLRQVVLTSLLCLRSASLVVSWTSINVITNQIADPRHRGFTTSTVQASACLSRAIGPTIGGAIWSWSENNNLEAPFDFHIFFLAVTFLAILQFTTATWIPQAAATIN